jgi:hypothetical protein
MPRATRTADRLPIDPDMPWTIFEGKEGWQGRIIVGKLPNGDPDPRHRRGKSYGEVHAKLAKLYAAAKAGEVTKTGTVPKVAEYLPEWLSHPDHEWRYSTKHATYDWAVYKYLIPALGGWRLDQIPPSVIEDFLKSLRRTNEQEEQARILGGRPKGLADASVHAVLRVLRSAQRRGPPRDHSP